MSGEPLVPESFDGRARLFPLPNLVLFPAVIQPLHIFEPRYRQMTAEALAGDRLLAIVLLCPGWEDQYEARPPVHPIACLAKIIADQRLDDGRYNLVVRGLKRVRLLDEIATPHIYRTARVELLEETGTLDASAAAALRLQLGEQIPRWVPPNAAMQEQFRKLLDSDVPSGLLCDVFSFALPIDVAVKQQLLEELNVPARALRLVEVLQGEAPIPATATERKFPPEFSEN